MININFGDPRVLAIAGSLVILLLLFVVGGALLPLAIILVPLAIGVGAFQVFKKNS